MDLLDVYLYGVLAATIDVERTRRRQRLVLTYTEQARHHVAVGQPFLSINLPLRRKPYVGVDGALPFCEGLLPEGEARRQIAARFDLEEGDVIGLLGTVGWECAGAVTVVPSGQPSVHPRSRWRPIDDDEVALRLRAAPRQPLGVSDVVRLSLGGAQPKILLARTSDGRWAAPEYGAPSTHILKPAHGSYPDLVANEALCMRIVAHLGIPAAHVDRERFDDVDTLVVERYDRVRGDDEQLRRVHQEDVVSALGIRPANKYLSNPKTGVTYQRIADTLRRYAPPNHLRNLLRLMVANTAIGNADAHGRNHGLLLHATGAVGLAPAYDVICTAVYPSLTRAASIPVAGVTRLERITAAHLAREAVSWGLAVEEARGIVHDTLSGMGTAVERARDESADQAGDDTTAAILRNMDGLLNPHARESWQDLQRLLGETPASRQPAARQPADHQREDPNEASGGSGGSGPTLGR